jgi:class 3 adenylate cyclase
MITGATQVTLGEPMSDPMAISRRLVAVFAADVEGYSRLVGADEVSTLRELTERRAILDRLIAGHRGRIANTAGDSVLAEFGSAVEAVGSVRKAMDPASVLPCDTGVSPRSLWRTRRALELMRRSRSPKLSGAWCWILIALRRAECSGIRHRQEKKREC